MQQTKLRFLVFLLLIAIAVMAGSVFFKNKHSDRQNKFNVILIVVDALRADHLSCYGYNRDTSPNIGKFAKEGVLFKNAFSQGPQTLMAIPSLFTSLYPKVIRVYKEDLPLADKFQTLPEVLNKYGYKTAAIVGPQLKGISNFGQRFQLFDMVEGFERSRSASYMTNRAIDWLDKNYSQPFFLYIHYLTVHTPYRLPEHYKNIFWDGQKGLIDEKDKEALINSISQEINGNFLHSFPTYEPSLALEYIISQYDGGVKFQDDQISVLLQRLKELGLSNNTLVVFTADHGEELLDHGQFFHGRSLYDELIHVPLIIRLPGVIPQGAVVTNLVGHIDIMPTILNILNIPVGDVIMQGISLMPLLNKKNNASYHVRDNGLFSESYLGEKIAVRTKEWKFVEKYDLNIGSFFDELYNLKRDPKETDNISDRFPDKVMFFKNRLKKYVSSCEKIRREILGDNFIEKKVILKEDVKKTLKSLGYLE